MAQRGNFAGRLYRGEVSIDFVGRQRLWYMISGAILVPLLRSSLPSRSLSRRNWSK